MELKLVHVPKNKNNNGGLPFGRTRRVMNVIVKGENEKGSVKMTQLMILMSLAFTSVQGFSSSFPSSSVKLNSFNSKELVLDPCFSEKAKKPVSCIPDFVNAAFGLKVETTSTCGRHEKQEFCRQPKSDSSLVFGSNAEKCHVCDDKTAEHAHPSEFLTDLHNPNNETCWQSDYIDKDNVSLTISLKKKFELTYISLHFCSEKPKTLVIYKSMDHGKSWQPFQFYADDCLGSFQRQKEVSITRANEQEALCVDSHMDPDSGTRIAFSTLADRPSAEDFEHSPVLQDWVTATDIRIVFPTSNSQSDEDQDDFVMDDEEEDEDLEDDEASNDILERGGKLANVEKASARRKSKKNSSLPWVGISDLAIGGRCKCNGHASQCNMDIATGEMNCECNHNTAGRECEKCKGKLRARESDS